MADSLETALGEAPPDTVAGLPADVRERLATQIVNTQRRQARLVTDAVAKALKGVPLPVRGIVRKALS